MEADRPGGRFALHHGLREERGVGRARGPGAEAEWLEELRVAYGAAPPDRFPQVARMATELPQQTLDSQFRYGLGLLLEGLAVRGEIG